MSFLFGKKSTNENYAQNSIVSNTELLPPVTEKEAYVRFRSDTLEKYLVSKKIDLSKYDDPIACADAFVKIKGLRATPKTPTEFKLSRSQRIAINSKIIVLKLTDLSLNRCDLTITSSEEDAILIINVSRSFSLSNGRLFFGGGIKADNVIINCAGFASMLGRSSATGTILTRTPLTITGGSTLEGEIIGSKPNVAGSAVYKNKTTENLIKLQAERDAENKRRQSFLINKK